MSRHYPEVASRAGHRCEYCRAPEAVFNSPFELDHITPIARGGKTQLENLALACRACNLWKAAHITLANAEVPIEVRLFHPRIDLWTEHLQVDPTGEILSLTEVGQATLQRLKMNDPAQRNARQYWMRLGLYP